MKKAIVTICNKDYAQLLGLWISALKNLTDLPLVVLCLGDFNPDKIDGVIFIKVNDDGNPFPQDLPDHACAEKLRLFQHLPIDILEILFIDVDVFVLRPFWESENLFSISTHKLAICPDLFVGYKEKMESEFCSYDQSFRMKFNPDGSYFYFNTGVFFASHQKHATWFSRFLSVWADYVSCMARYPSIFDQNVFNYCLIRYGIEVYPLSILNNCLRQYEEQTISNGNILLNGKPVNAYHFNGGDGQRKSERWVEMVRKMEETYD